MDYEVLTKILLILCLMTHKVSAQRPQWTLDSKIDSYQQITDMFTKMSVPKPLKCPLFNYSPRPNTNNQFRKLLSFYKCRHENDWIPFNFKGSLVNSTLVGPGKLTFLPKTDIFHNSDPNKSICFSLDNLLGSKVKSIVGTFQNGTLIGSAKITFDNQHFAITSFEKGVMNGIHRTFDEKQSLIHLTIMEHNQVVPLQWSKLSKNVYFFDQLLNVSTVDEMISSIAFNTTNQVWMSGTFFNYLQSFRNIYKPFNVLVSESNWTPCIFEVRWKKEESVSNIHFDMTYDDFISSSPQKLYNENIFKDFSKSPGEKLKYFLGQVESLGYLNAYPHVFPPSDNKINFLSNLTKNSGLLNEFPFQFIQIRGAYDSSDKLHGENLLKITSSTPSSLFDFTFVALYGIFRHGVLLDGPVLVKLSDTREAWLYIVSNTIHGTMYISGRTTILPQREKINSAYIGGGTLLQYENGRPGNEFLITMIGNGILLGSMTHHKISGNSISYIYPDYYTVYNGFFENKVMKKAHLFMLSDLHIKNGFLIPELKRIPGDERVFYYEAPNNVSNGAGPPGLDPFDAYNTEVKKSASTGQGLFAKRDFEVGQVICLYSGYLYNDIEHSNYKNKYSSDKETNDEDKRHFTKYSLSIQISGNTIDISPENDRNSSGFVTNGPKTNHKFYENQAQFYDFESPRWGLISSLIAIKNISKGEEVFTSYNYRKSPFPHDFPWYWELKESVDKEREKETRHKKLLKRNTKKKNKKKNNNNQKISNLTHKSKRNGI